MSLMLAITACSSCSKDDDDQPDNPSSTNQLVGTWYFSYQGDTDYDDYFIFRSNGTGEYNYYDEHVDFNYSYDQKSEILTVKNRYGETDRLLLYWLGNNRVEFDDFGVYIRK